MGDVCPFMPSDYVIYRPSSRGAALEAMSSPSESLVPGKTYRVKEIQKGAYIAVEDHAHPGGGLHWTEFERPQP
jgi:hypothetical protein